MTSSIFERIISIATKLNFVRDCLKCVSLLMLPPFQNAPVSPLCFVLPAEIFLNICVLLLSQLRCTLCFDASPQGSALNPLQNISYFSSISYFG